MTWLVRVKVPGVWPQWRRVSGVTAYFAQRIGALCMGISPEYVEVLPW